MYYPNTLDQRRLNNSNAKTLLQNWVEERAVDQFDRIPQEYIEKDEPYVKYYKDGHKGLITVDQNPLVKNTTYKDDFIRRNNYDPNGEAKGIRYKLTEEMLTRKLTEQLEAEQNAINEYDEPINYTSETQEKYVAPGFVSKPPNPTARHDVYSEMPVSFWSEHRNKAHGVTQFKTLDSPFRRNAAFTTPGSDSYDQAKPGELENYPYMSQKSNNSAPIY